MLLFILGVAAITQEAEAKGVIVYHNGPTISKVADLPEDATIDDTHVNLAVMYDQFGLFWLPVWNYGDTKYVLVDDTENTYWDVDEKLLETIKEDYSLDVAATPSIPFLSKVGLKPIIVLIALYFVWSALFSKKEEELEEE